MALADPFVPISAEEAAEVEKPKAKVDKVPILPVPESAPPCAFRIPALGGAPVRKWEYRDAAGRLLGYDARFEYEQDGQRCKDVLPITFCQVGDRQDWRSKAFPAPRPLYGLDRLAARKDAPVVVAEGAKSADAAGALLPGYVAVSWSGGGKAVSHTNWRDLAGRDVLVWPDRDRQCERSGAEKPYEDQPGTIAAENIVAKLKTVAARVRVLKLENFECADGWDADDAVQAGWTSDQAAAFVDTYSEVVDVDGPGIELPYGFENSADGLYYVDGEDRRMWICGRLKVLAKTRDGAGSGWGLLLEWRDGDGTVHRWAMPKAMLAGDGTAIREELLSRGFDISTDSKAKGRFLQFLAGVDIDVRARAVEKVGWSGPAFALPHITIGDTATDRVIFQNGDAGAHQYHTSGTLTEWQERVAVPAIGNSRIVFMISAAFVGPILTPAMEEGGGVNLVGASSTGKTTGLRAAASVWGPALFMRTWRATGNGLEGVAVQHSETLLCLDELGQLDPREVGQVAYMLGNGQGKTRASRSGSSRVAASWNVMFLSTGEIGLADLAREGKPGRNAQAGQEVRILDVPADAGKGMGCFERLNGSDSAAAFSRQLSTSAREVYGTAAIAYIEAVAAVRSEVGDMIAASMAEFQQTFVSAESDGQVIRAGRRFGLIAAAGELAIALGILPWPTREAFDAAGVMFRAWVARRGGTGSAEDRNIIERLCSFIDANGDARFSPMTGGEEYHRTVINRAGFFRNTTVNDTTVREYLFLPTAFKEVFIGFDQKHVRDLLLERGILIPGGDKSSQSLNLPELGKKRCYVINPAGLSDEA